MNAVISGEAGVALVIDDARLFSLQAEAPEELQPRQPEEYPWLFQGALDLRFLEDVSLQQVRDHLRIETAGREALDLALILLDGAHSDELRREAAQELHDLAEKDAVAQWAESVLYAAPLPEDCDLTGALRHCEGPSRSRARALMEHLRDQQSAIKETCSAWDNVPGELFGGPEAKRRARSQLIRAGIFRRFAEVMEQGQPLDPLLFEMLSHPEIRSLKNHRQIIMAWSQPLRPPIRTALETEMEESAGEEAEADEALDARARGPAFPHRRVQRLPADMALAEVNKRKELILDAVRKGLPERARVLCDDLIWYQRSTSNKSEHISKSLCDLAGRARRLGAHGLQLEWADRAKQECPRDDWAWSQYATALLDTGKSAQALEAHDHALALGGRAVAQKGRAEALKALGKFDEALAAYDEVRREHSQDVVAQAGRAEVLKALGKFDEALAAYEEARREHPEDVVVKTGRAEVLKALGKLDEALAAYDEVIREHPEEVFAKTGRAEVLKALGKFDEALAAYDEARREHPENVVAKTGRAEVLKALGKFDEALVVYDEVNRKHPWDVVAQNGRACVLAALGRLEEALSQLPDRNAVTFNDWVGLHIRGVILMRQNKLEEAIRIFERGIREDPFLAHRDYFRNALAVARLRRREPAQALEALAQVKSFEVKDQANLLRVHTLELQDAHAAAVDAFKSLPNKGAVVYLAVRSEIEARFITRRPQHRGDQWLLDKEADLLLAA